MRIASIICLLKTFALSGICQGYQPFPTSNAMWRQTYNGYQCTFIDYQYTIIGDTVISDLTYHKLRKNGFQVSYFDEGYIGAFRDDVANKKVYFINEGMTEEAILYDFDLNIGDTLSATQLTQQIEYYVTQIDSVLLNNVYHRTYNLEAICAYDEKVIIEGVGCTSGLLEEWYCSSACTSSLVCFNIDGVVAYHYNGWDFCIPTITEDINDPIIIVLFPNPSVGNLHIRTNVIGCNFQVYNANGQVVHSGELLETESEFDMSSFLPGIYLVHARGTNGHSFTSKIQLN